MKELARIQRELKVPKTLRNAFGKYNYRSTELILEAVKKCLRDDETLIISDELVLIGDRFYVKATATFSNGEQEVSVTGYAREAELKKGMDEAQITGSASSYARKYALNGLFAIDDTKDADDLNKHELKKDVTKDNYKKILEIALKEETKLEDLLSIYSMTQKMIDFFKKKGVR